jgi:hypothetical protein
MQRAVAAAADVGGASPVEELVAGGGAQQDLARGRTLQRRPHAGERVGVVGGDQAVVLDARLQYRELTLDAPRAAARVADGAARREAQLAAGPVCDHPLAGGIVRVALQPHHQVDALQRERAGGH